jgi:hypothetical protein
MTYKTIVSQVIFLDYYYKFLQLGLVFLRMIPKKSRPGDNFRKYTESSNPTQWGDVSALQPVCQSSILAHLATLFQMISVLGLPGRISLNNLKGTCNIMSFLESFY